jgi:hypothetical protein
VKNYIRNTLIAQIWYESALLWVKPHNYKVVDSFLPPPFPIYISLLGDCSAAGPFRPIVGFARLRKIFLATFQQTPIYEMLRFIASFENE